MTSENTKRDWSENERNWKEGYTVNFSGEITKLNEASEAYLMNLVRFYGDTGSEPGGFDTSPVKEELMRRWSTTN